MADNVQITAGSGTIIRAIDLGGGVEAQCFIVLDGSGNVIGSTLGNNGRGINVVVLNDVAVKGKLAVGDLAVGDRPVLIGGRVGAGIAQRTLISDSNMIDAAMTGDGRQVVLPIGPPEDQGLTNPIVAAADTSVHTLIAAQAAGVKIALWGMEATNLNPSVDTAIIFFDGATERGRMGIPRLPGRGVTWPAPIKTTAATALNYQLTASVGTNQLYLTPFWYITKE